MKQISRLSPKGVSNGKCATGHYFFLNSINIHIISVIEYHIKSIRYFVTISWSGFAVRKPITLTFLLRQTDWQMILLRQDTNVISFIAFTFIQKTPALKWLKNENVSHLKEMSVNSRVKFRKERKDLVPATALIPWHSLTLLYLKKQYLKNIFNSTICSKQSELSITGILLHLYVYLAERTRKTKKIWSCRLVHPPSSKKSQTNKLKNQKKKSEMMSTLTACWEM